jgi:hypothetical protein
LKKIVRIFLTIIVLFSFASATVLIPKDVMEEAVKNNSPEVIVRNYMMPYFSEHPREMVILAAEINLSNGGHKDTVDVFFGERLMFGCLVDHYMISDRLDELSLNSQCYFNETFRLFFGEWFDYGYSKGHTILTFGYRHDCRIMDFERCDWSKKVYKSVPCILIEHITEYGGMSRFSAVQCDFETLVNGNYEATFEVVRGDAFTY